ncbi:hypothetical protein [Epilithonimonas arachidiradicis]|uniref:Lycopene cyclase domain-containing protein n=1 Tax=Epilithonimonas arachidiradicis TaxID=1617282 RepID=A0A420CPQ9_9FLAO|nr:hypothetical protein [Epilithonimonas arachidiradicis]RKE80404.1 hypothetical protein BXY58_2927 [Epilithonimonas arachidiradicis]GGG63953.1 hypothetical protein GCM10007332_27780 [Epilithonimonas arachidiradicis]
MLLGIFDYILLIVILIFNIGVWKYKIIKKGNKILYLSIFLLFGFIIPFFSIDFEIKNLTKNIKEIDSFTFLYTYFRFPTWWLFGISEIFFLKYQIKTVKNIDG